MLVVIEGLFALILIRDSLKCFNEVHFVSHIISISMNYYFQFETHRETFKWSHFERRAASFRDKVLKSWLKTAHFELFQGRCAVKSCIWVTSAKNFEVSTKHQPNMIWITNTILVIFGPKIKLWLISISSTTIEHTLLILLRSILLFLERQIHHSSRSKPVSSSGSYREETIHRLFAFVKIQIVCFEIRSWNKRIHDLSQDDGNFCWVFLTRWPPR